MGFGWGMRQRMKACPPQVKFEVGGRKQGDKNAKPWSPRASVKSACRKTHNGKDKARNIPISRTKVEEFFGTGPNMWSQRAEAEDRGCDMRT